MSAHTATVSWSRGAQAFGDGKYSRGHLIAFDDGVSIPGSSAPQVVRPPLSVEAAADPEELLVAALSSCHMLFFLDFARKAGFIVDSYVDSAHGVMGTIAGATALAEVTLRPAIAWSGAATPDAAQLADLHHKAHAACFIANSFKGVVQIAPA